MYTPDDVARSIRRYVGMTLDSPPWRMRVEKRQVDDDERPVLVVMTGDMTPTGAVATGRQQGNVTEVLPVTIYAYPAFKAEETAITERQGRANADALRTRLHRLIEIGIPFENTTTGRPAAGPMCLPLFDYAATKLEGADDRDEPEDPHDVLWVPEGSLVSRVIQDADDPRRFTVVCEFRASMEFAGLDPDFDAPAATVGPGTPGFS